MLQIITLARSIVKWVIWLALLVVYILVDTLFGIGMLALGVYHNINPNTRERDLKNAKGLAYILKKVE